mmetsp:Transcript_32872/g.93422  ORF Transcript_32872/g.93422 Transcript_32872/m.93422 type:complete len:266 (-) Transcript_32872:794-1591(-)
MPWHSWKKFFTVGHWLAGQSRATSIAMLTYSALRSGSFANRRTSSSLVVLQLRAASSGVVACRRKAYCMLSGAPGLAVRSSRRRAWQISTARLERLESRSQHALGRDLQKRNAPSWLQSLSSKALLQVNSSKSMTPQLKMSAFGVISPAHTSGAIVYGVPAGRSCEKLPGLNIWATPRSMTTTCGFTKSSDIVSRRWRWTGTAVSFSGISMTFAGLRSRWTTPLACTYAIADMICLMTKEQNISSRGLLRTSAVLIRFRSSPPEQ